MFPATHFDIRIPQGDLLGPTEGDLHGYDFRRVGRNAGNRNLCRRVDKGVAEELFQLNFPVDDLADAGVRFSFLRCRPGSVSLASRQRKVFPYVSVFSANHCRKGDQRRVLAGHSR